MQAAAWIFRRGRNAYLSFAALPSSHPGVQLANHHLCQRRIRSSSIPLQRSQNGITDLGPLSQGSNPNALEEAAILSRAQNYGINSIARLALESQLRTSRGIGSRMTDIVVHRNDMKLWAILLDYQLLQYGVEGAKTIFRGMKYRGPKLKLNDNDPDANEIWQKLLSSAAQDKEAKLIFVLCEQNGLGWERPNLFAESVGMLLKHNKDWHAAKLAHQLRRRHFYGQADVLELYRIYKPQDYHEFKQFFEFYQKLPLASIYTDTVSELWQENRSADAFLMHQFLLARGDMPPSFDHIEPFLQHLAQKNEDPTAFLKTLTHAGVSFSNQGRRAYSKEQSRTVGMSPDSLNIVASHTFGYKPKKLSDAFVARALATRALSFDFVLSSLQMLGLIEVGPQSVREMGLSAPDLQTLRQRFARLGELGIDTGSSAYNRLVKTIVMNGQSSLLQQVLQTDMHHDVFEDSKLQAKLLAEAFAKRDWSKVNLLFAMMFHGQNDEKLKTFSVDLLLRSALKQQDWRSTLVSIQRILDIVAESDNWGMVPHVTRKSLEELVRLVLLPNEHNQRATAYIINRPRLVAGILQDLMSAGLHVPLLVWREPLKALGYSGNFEDLERMIVWLGRWYRLGGLNKDVLSTPVHEQDSELGTLFDKKFQAAIVHWGYLHYFKLRHQLKRNAMPIPAWKRSLHLLKHLQIECGVSINHHGARKAISMRIFRENKLQEMQRLGIRQYKQKWQGLLSNNLRDRARSRIIPVRGLNAFSHVEYFYNLFGKEIPPRVLEHLRLHQTRGRQLNRRLSRARKPEVEDQAKNAVTVSSHGVVEDVNAKTAHRLNQENESDVVQYTDFFHPAAEEYNDEKPEEKSRLKQNLDEVNRELSRLPKEK